MTPLPHVDSMPRKVTTKVHTSLSVDRKACARVLCPPSRSGAAGRVKTADFAKTREEQTVTREFESKERPSGHEVASFARRRRLLATKSRVPLQGEHLWPRTSALESLLQRRRRSTRTSHLLSSATRNKTRTGSYHRTRTGRWPLRSGRSPRANPGLAVGVRLRYLNGQASFLSLPPWACTVGIATVRK